MLRRLSLIAASAGMLALSALPASAATMQSSAQKISFPALSGVNAWGTYARTSRDVKVEVCAEDTSRRVFAAGAVVLAYNASGSQHANLGAVDIGYRQPVCRTMTLRYTGHLKVYTFTGNSNGRIGSQSRIKNIY